MHSSIYIYIYQRQASRQRLKHIVAVTTIIIIIIIRFLAMFAFITFPFLVIDLGKISFPLSNQHQIIGQHKQFSVIRTRKTPVNNVVANRFPQPQRDLLSRRIRRYFQAILRVQNKLENITTPHCVPCFDLHFYLNRLHGSYFLEKNGQGTFSKPTLMALPNASLPCVS